MDHPQHNYSPDRARHGAQGDPETAPSLSAHETAARSELRTRLLHDFVVLRFPDLPKEHRVGDVAIALPDNRYFQSTMRDATVVAVGPGKWFMPKSGGGKERGRREHWHPTTVQVGDRVLIDALLTQEGLLDEWDGERGDFRLVREKMIAGVLDAVVEVRVA